MQNKKKSNQINRRSEQENNFSNSLCCKSRSFSITGAAHWYRL